MNNRLLRRFKLIQHDPKAAPLFFRPPKRVARRLRCYGCSIFARLYADETGREIPATATDPALVRAAFFTSMEDWLTKQGRADFYDANALLFVRYVPRACSCTGSDNEPYESPASHMIGDAQHLLQQHNSWMGDGHNDYGYSAAAFVPFFRLYQQSVKIADGQPVNDAHMGANTIRVAIEMRLKSALGTFSIYNKRTGKISDVKLADIFHSFELHASDIEIGVDLSLIRLIYRWSCNYIHSGMVSYKWLTYFAHDLIEPLFRPHFLERNTENWDFGIVMKRGTLEAARDAVGKMSARNDAFHINGPPIDQCSVGILRDLHRG